MTVVVCGYGKFYGLWDAATFCSGIISKLPEPTTLKFDLKIPRIIKIIVVVVNRIFALLCRSRPLKLLGRVLLTTILVLLIWDASRLYLHAQQPTDAVLVLGGSIRREMSAAQLRKTLPDIPILISGGSPVPCLALLFERENASLNKVYSDRCPRGTWGNVYHSTPILRSWHSQHVRLITSPSHLPRALWMARIHLGIHGIWVESAPVVEQGHPGNKEYWWKTGLDLLRTLGSALWSLFEAPQAHCPLTSIPSSTDLAQWDGVKRPEAVKCEHQGGLDEALAQWQQQLNAYRQFHQNLEQ